MNAQNAKDYLPLIEALAAGKTIQILDAGMDWNDARELVFVDVPEHYRIKPDPKTRPMTRNEVLGFLTNTRGIVTKYKNGEWQHPGVHRVPVFGSPEYVWAFITPDGVIGEPHRFEIEEES